MKFRDFKIGNKLALGFGLVIIIVIIVGTVSVYRLLEVAELTEKIYYHPLNVGYSVRDIKANINGMHRSMKDVATGESKAEIEEAIRAVDLLEIEVYKSFRIVFERFLGDMTDVYSAHESFEQWKSIRDEVIRLSLSGNKREAVAITRGKGAAHVVKMNTRIQKMIDFANSKADSFLQGARDKKKSMIVVLIVFVSLMIALGMVISFAIARSIVRPLSKILANIENIARGNLSDDITITGKGEIGILADSFRALQRDLKYRVGQAKKIIDGDFSHDIPPRSDKDELGQTFYKMSQSIRTITKDLSLSEQKLRTIMDSAPAGILQTDKAGKIIDINKTALELLGFVNKEECTGLNWSDFFPDKSEYSELCNFLEKVSGIQGKELELKRRDGSYFWGAVSTVRKKITTGEIIFLTTVVDLTARKVAEDKLSESEARYRSVFSTAGSVIVCLDQSYRIIEWNLAAENIFGYRRDEVIGKNYLQLIVDPDYALLVEKDFKKVLNGLATEHFEYRTITSDGEGKYLLWNVTGLTDSGRSNKGLIAIGQDLTESKRAEKEKALLKLELMQSQKMESLGTLAGGIAHDFNNILSVIMGYTEISMGGVNTPELIENMNQVLKASLRARDLVHQILAFSRKTETSKSFVEVVRIVQEAVKFMRASLPTSIKLDFKHDKELALVCVNPTQINQIVMNLCSNAAHAIGNRQGYIDIGLKDVIVNQEVGEQERIEPGEYQQLTIRDSGDGIGTDIIGRIFEPYFTTKKSGEGSGMGLAVVYGIVKSYGGFVNVGSEEGEGTTFDIYLPVGQAADVSVRKQIEKAESLRGNERVMFVDDEPALVDLWDMVLKAAGYKVESFKESLQAFDAFKENPDKYDIVVADINMPNMTGLSLLKGMREKREGIPVILCTGYTGIAKEEVLNSSGVDALLIKPVSKNKMLRTIRTIFDKR